MKSVITIGRQYGSDGRAIGKKIAEDLNIPFYDKEILARAAKETGFSEEIIKENDEKKTSSFLYSLVMDSNFFGINPGFAAGPDNLPLSQKIFIAQCNTIKAIAAEGPCVIVGRCSDYVLEESTNLINIFIHADIEARCRTVMARDGLGEKQALETIVRTDKERLSYYNYYTNKAWGDSNNYDLTIDSSKLGIDGTAAVIEAYIKECENK